MATMNVSLPETMKPWVEMQAKNGSYTSASDYFRSMVRREQEHVRALGQLQALIDEGLASGPAETFDMESFLTRKHQEHAESST